MIESSSLVSGSIVTARNVKGVNLGTPFILLELTARTSTVPSHLQSVVRVLALVMLIVLRLGFVIIDTADSRTQLICAPESTRMDLGVIANEADPERKVIGLDPCGLWAPSLVVPYAFSRKFMMEVSMAFANRNGHPRLIRSLRKSPSSLMLLAKVS